MKLFIKLCYIIITNKKFINWKKLNTDIVSSLANSPLLFHPEDQEARKYLTAAEVRILVSDE